MKTGECFVGLIPLFVGIVLCWLSLRSNPPIWILPFWYQQLQAKGADESSQLLKARATSFVGGVGFVMLGLLLLYMGFNNQ